MYNNIYLFDFHSTFHYVLGIKYLKIFLQINAAPVWHTISNSPSFFFETELRSHPELRYSSVNKGSYSL